jgi:hypothetical protein
MSNITHISASFPAASSRSSNRASHHAHAVALSAELRDGLDELKKELQAFLKSEERQ